MQRGAFGVLEAVRERLARHGRAAEPRVVLRNRAVGIDPDHTAGEIAARVGLAQEVAALDAVDVGIVEPERVGSRHVHRPVAREHDPPLDVGLDQYLEVLEPAVVGRELRAGDGFLTEVHRAPLGERLVPDLVVEMLDGPLARCLAFGGAKYVK